MLFLKTKYIVKNGGYPPAVMFSSSSGWVILSPMEVMLLSIVIVTFRRRSYSGPVLVQLQINRIRLQQLQMLLTVFLYSSLILKYQDYKKLPNGFSYSICILKIEELRY